LLSSGGWGMGRGMGMEDGGWGMRDEAGGERELLKVRVC